jgi:circadian clock protein KaiC
MAQRRGTAPDWLETGVPHLDRILGGGLLRRSTAMVIGAPGTGKTILAQQIAFHGAARGSATLYLTGYSETHDKLLSHSRTLGFFAPAAIGKQINFASLMDLLREGADGTEDAVVATARAQDASLVVLDGFRSMRGFLADDRAAAHFLYSLGAKLALLGATTLVLVEGDPEDSARYPELTVCDVILALRHEYRGSRQRRLLTVVKARGSAPLYGAHPFTISHRGILVSPHFESVVPATEPAWDPGRAGFGVASVDAMLGGGLNVGTATLVAGSPGVGKTLLGLNFIAEAARAGEPALFLGFMESAPQLREKARMFGMDLTAAEAAGRARLLVLPGYDLEADEIAEILREDIERRGVRRLVIDSAKELERGIGSPERVPDFMSALVNYLRGREVTTYLTLDVPTIVGPELQFAGTPLHVLAENFLLLRQVEYRGRLHRVFSVLKLRFSDYDRAIYEYTITPGQGLQMLGPAPLGEGLLTGLVRPAGDPPAQSPPGGSQREPWPQS